MADGPRTPRITTLTKRIVVLAVIAILLSLAVAVVPAAATAETHTANTVTGHAILDDDEPENVTLYRAENHTFDDADAVTAAIANGTVEDADELVAGDTLVVAVESERLADDLDSRNGTATERFFDALDGEADFRIVQTNPTPERRSKTATVGRDNATAYRDGTTTYVLVDAGNLSYRYDEDSQAELRGGERFAVTVGYGLDDRTTAGPEFELYTRKASFSGLADHEQLPPEIVNRSVDVSIEPVDSVVARITFDDNRTIIDTAEPVEWSGWPGVSLDLRDVEPGTEYTLELLHDGTVVDRRNGTVREPEATVSNVSVTQTDSVTVVSGTVELSHGGEVQILDEHGEELGTERIEPGVERRVRIRLHPPTHNNAEELHVRAAREDGAAEEYYQGPDTEVTIGFEDREIQAPYSTETSTVTETTSDETRSASTDSSSESMPGFGPVVTLVAMSVLLSAARRRA